MANTLTKLASITVGAGGSSSLDFTNIPQTYTDLVLKVSARDNRSGSVDTPIGIYINGVAYPDPAASYRILVGSGSAASSANQSGFYIQAGYTTSGSATANTFSNTEMYFPNYTGANFKSVSTDGAAETNATGVLMQMSAGLRSNVAPITQIQVQSGYTFVQYTTATLYGVFNEDVSVAPAVPTIGTASDGGTGTTASVAFTPVSGAASYTATSTPGSFTGTALTTPVTVGGLTTGTAYTFKVKANNPIGSSGESAASNSVTILPGGAFESIATINAAGGESQIVFSSISGTYSSLQIRSVTTSPAAGWDIRLEINGVSTDSYNTHWLRGTGSAVQAGANGGAQTYGNPYSLNAGTTTTYPAVAIMDIHDYASSTKFKTIRTFYGADINGTGGETGLTSVLFKSTTPITSIRLYLSSTTFNAGSKFALYGIKGA